MKQSLKKYSKTCIIETHHCACTVLMPYDPCCTGKTDMELFVKKTMLCLVCHQVITS